MPQLLNRPRLQPYFPAQGSVNMELLLIRSVIQVLMWAFKVLFLLLIASMNIFPSFE